MKQILFCQYKKSTEIQNAARDMEVKLNGKNSKKGNKPGARKRAIRNLNIRVMYPRGLFPEKRFRNLRSYCDGWCSDFITTVSRTPSITGVSYLSNKIHLPKRIYVTSHVLFKYCIYSHPRGNPLTKLINNVAVYVAPVVCSFLVP